MGYQDLSLEKLAPISNISNPCLNHKALQKLAFTLMPSDFNLFLVFDKQPKSLNASYVLIPMLLVSQPNSIYHAKLNFDLFVPFLLHNVAHRLFHPTQHRPNGCCE